MLVRVARHAIQRGCGFSIWLLTAAAVVSLLWCIAGPARDVFIERNRDGGVSMNRTALGCNQSQVWLRLERPTSVLPFGGRKKADKRVCGFVWRIEESSHRHSIESDGSTRLFRNVRMVVVAVPTWLMPIAFGVCAFICWFYGPHRRRVRILQGKCVCCGYDLRGGPGKICPECGAAKGLDNQGAITD